LAEGRAGTKKNITKARKYKTFEKEIKMKKIISLLLVIALLSTMVSCIAVGSGGKKVENQPTLGQQLIDLKKAQDEGAVSKQEYAELREKLKKSYEDHRSKKAE
jgi:hypothetical protein